MDKEAIMSNDKSLSRDTSAIHEDQSVSSKTGVVLGKTAIRPKTIDIEVFRLCKKKLDEAACPPSKMKIPGIIQNQANPLGNLGITEQVRVIINGTTSDSLEKMKRTLQVEVSKNAAKEADLDEIADIFLNFMIKAESPDKSDDPSKVILMIMSLLNSVYAAASSEPTKGTASKTIGRFFLEKCRTTVFSKIQGKVIQEFAEKTEEGDDGTNEYLTFKSRLINLVVIICLMYEQRKQPKICIQFKQIHSVIEELFNLHKNSHEQWSKMKDSKDSNDRYKSRVLRTICDTYAELLMEFLSRVKSSFELEAAENRDSAHKIQTRFQKQVVDTLPDGLIKTKCSMNGWIID